MRLLIDFENSLTRVENRNSVEPILEQELLNYGDLISNNYTIFKPFCNNIDIHSLGIQKDKLSFEESVRNFLTIKEQLISNESHIKAMDFEIYQKLKRISTDRIFLQKVTYQVDEGEEIESIFALLSNQNSQAIYKKFFLSEDKIIAFSSTFGLWIVENQKYFKTAEVRESDKIRTTCTLRQLKYPSKMQSLDKINYPLFEDLKLLFENRLIDKFYKVMTLEDGSQKADTLSTYALSYHFKSKLDESDLKEIEIRQRAMFELVKENSHIYRGTATNTEVSEMNQKNLLEIHTNYVNIDDLKYQNEINELKSINIEAFLELQERLLLERQKQENLELKERIYRAKEGYKSAKEEFILALKNGATILEARDMLESSKYNYITIELVLEEIKSEIILSHLKDKVIESKQENIDKLLKVNQQLNFKVEEAKEFLEKSNLDIQLAIESIEKLKEVIVQKEATIYDLKVERDELKVENETFERELNLKYNKTKRKRLVREYAKKVKSKK